MDPTSLKLKHACFAGDLDEVCRLLDSGADPNSTDEHGSGTLLTFHPAVIEYLLSRGANPNIQFNENGSSVVAGLTYVNQLECVRILLRAGADANRGRDASGETPLHHALATNAPDRSPLVKLLLVHGANPNAKTKPGIRSYNFWRDARTRGETPLHRAAAFSPAETIELLLEAGADRTVRDVNGDSPLGWASWHLRNRPIIDLLNPETAYVWAFANLEEVVYIYRPSREGEFLRELLKGFRGVLVTDFYTAYDALECPQQKCLVHLIRDMNDDLIANPFDDELQAITQPFGALLRPIVTCIGEHGLRRRYLGRFKRSVAEFFHAVSSSAPRSDVACSLRERLLKYQSKLFTFLDFDNVPWNNNNAENAIKRFALYRARAAGMMKDCGLETFLKLLSICQTCRYKGLNFWRYLCSRKRDIDDFAASQRSKPPMQLEICPEEFPDK